MSIGKAGGETVTGAISSGIDSVTQGLTKAALAGGAPVIADAIQVFGSSAKTAFNQAVSMAGAQPNVGVAGHLEQPLEFFGKFAAGKAEDLVRALTDSNLPVNEKSVSALGKASEDLNNEILRITEKLAKDGPGADNFKEQLELRRLQEKLHEMEPLARKTRDAINQAQEGIIQRSLDTLRNR